jgi:hypothetical protein
MHSQAWLASRESKTTCSDLLGESQSNPSSKSPDRPNQKNAARVSGPGIELHQAESGSPLILVKLEELAMDDTVKLAAEIFARIVAQRAIEARADPKHFPGEADIAYTAAQTFVETVNQRKAIKRERR